MYRSSTITDSGSMSLKSTAKLSILGSFACTLDRSGANCEWKRASLLSLSKVSRSKRVHGTLAPSGAGLASKAVVSKEAIRGEQRLPFEADPPFLPVGSQ